MATPKPIVALGAEAERSAANRSAVLAAVLVIAFGTLGTTLAQTQILGRLPIQNLLKNVLHVDRAANAAFFFWVGIPWYLKPLFGIVCDAFPLFGSRRKHYLLLGAGLATLAWLALAITPLRYEPLLMVSLVINFALVIASTAMGGYMVEVAQSSTSSGRLTSVRNFMQQFSYVVTGPLGGYLASLAFGWTPTSCALVVFLIVPVTLALMREPSSRVDSSAVLGTLRLQLQQILRAKSMWATAGLAALFYFAPGLFTATFYRQQNLLHMSTQGQGFLILLQGLCGIGAAALYGGFLCRKLTLRRLLVVGLLSGTVANLAYLFYNSVLLAQIIESFWGLGYTLAELAMMHLMVRVTPAGSEALGFALLFSVRNLGIFGGDWFGSYLLDQYHLQYSTLVLANAATSLIAVPLSLLLPLALVNVRDRTQ
jgi:predicted MFS family arabinose efflux permease